MGLKTYRAKRRFDRTPEPAGREARRAGFSFTIQRHHASRLHYDFRLELDGVLKSWAVPKGPCLDPAERRLAVEVEDHPVEYGTFEGEIPKGEYGGGTVALWDRGSWEPLGDPRAGLRKGHLRFTLRGRKLEGRWDLVLMRRRGGDDGKRNWLLIKAADEHARPLSEYDVTEARPESVSPTATRRAKRVWHSDRAPAKSARPASRRRGAPARRPETLDPGALPGAKKAALPESTVPELCTLVDAAPDGDEWLHEIKLDGYRIVASVKEGAARLTTRRGNDWTAQFPQIASALAELPARGCLLDGEIVVLDERGVSSFQALQNALKRKGRGRLAYFVFDLLHLDGWDLTAAPLADRKTLLARLLARAPEGIKLCEHVRGNGPAFLKRACELGLEGVVCKRADSPYAGARSRQWLKAKCLKRQEFVVCGYTAPKGTRSGFGALVLGLQEKGGLRYAGKVGTGFSEKTIADLTRRLRGLETSATPFSSGVSATKRGMTFVIPRLVAEVAFGEWTDDGLLRQPRYLGLREDKPAAEVRREEALPVAKAARASAPAAPEGAAGASVVAGVRLSNPERALYPELGLTKLELARYYEAVAEAALPHLARRPLSLVRCPRGRGAHCFFQKHFGPERPPELEAVPIVENGVERQYSWLKGASGLVALAQLGVLEIHPWGSTVEDLERPDVMTFDLDPATDLGWPRLVEAARELRARLKDIGLTSFLKTTGGKGLHLVVPLKPRADWTRVKQFSKTLVEAMVAQAPSLYTSKITKSSRAGRIFLDYLRNGRGATAVGAYSTRARPGAPVATPVAWDELGKEPLGPRFTVRTVPARLARLRKDPWAGYFDLSQSVR